MGLTRVRPPCTGGSSELENSCLDTKQQLIELDIGLTAQFLFSVKENWEGGMKMLC